MDIQEFLLARIAEDEAGADTFHEKYCGWCLHEGPGFNEDGCICGHPQKILRECAAKRVIIEVVVKWVHTYNDEDMWYSCPLAVEPGQTAPGSGYSGNEAGCRCGLASRQMQLLQPLAAVYPDHPDYQQKWSL